MATARMTDDLITKLCDKFIKDYYKLNPKPELDPELGLEIYNTHCKPFFDELKAVTDKSPFGAMQKQSFFDESAEFYVQVFIPDQLSHVQEYRESKTNQDGSLKEVGWQLKEYLTTFQFDDEEIQITNAKFDLPYVVTQMVDKYNSNIPFPFTEMTSDPLYQDVRNQLMKRIKAEHSMKKDVREYFNTLDRFETLNQALKAWPQLATAVEQVMPEKMVAINRRTERKKKQLENQNVVEQVSQKFNNVMLGSTLLGDDDDYS
tara:strand:- start:2598 stop:3380 length:783 start_codon:yes stop_codon:yes gene_type:complete